MDREFLMNAGMTMPFLEQNSSVDNYGQFESSLMNSNISDDAFALRELIGKLRNVPSTSILPNHYDSLNISSPPQLHLLNSSNMINSVPLTSVSADPGFAERAAKFSCFGSRSFNGRSVHTGMNNAELRNRSGSPLMGNEKLLRVSSSPVLKQVGSPVENGGLSRDQVESRVNQGGLSGSDKKMRMLLGSGSNSNDESSVSEQVSKTSNEMSSRKRKTVSRGKAKDDGFSSAKEVVENEDANAKRLKATENGKNKSVAKTEEEQKEGSNEKAAEPLKDYIHVRARRGQATDSHSLAERVRREKIGERMKLLQDLVPGCNKVTGKALMLDEIINYVQSLQRQVEFLSMKLATVNPELDCNTDNINLKDLSQKGSEVPHELHPLDFSAFYNQNRQAHQQNVQQINNANFGIQLPPLDGFSASLHEFPTFPEDDLHSIVQMGFAQNTFNFPVPYQLSDMKAER